MNETCPTCGAPALASFPAGTLYACQGVHATGTNALVIPAVVTWEDRERAAFKRGAAAMKKRSHREIMLLIHSGTRDVYAIADAIRELPEPEFVNV